MKAWASTNHHHVVTWKIFSRFTWFSLVLSLLLQNLPTNAFTIIRLMPPPTTTTLNRVPHSWSPQYLSRTNKIHPLTLTERPSIIRSTERSSTELSAFLSSSSPSGDSWKERWLEKLPSSSVVTALEKQQKSSSSLSSKDGKITWMASDVAALAGVSLSQANRELTALASLTQGDIAVTSNGDLLYTFPDNIRQVLSQNSAKYKALQTWQTAVWPRLFWFLRVSFGVTLLVSLVAIFATVVFAGSYASSSNSDNDSRDNRRESNNGGGMRMGGGGWNFFWGPSPLDFFYYRPYYGSYYNRQQQQPTRQEVRDPEEMGFLESIFSYVFGDGNPNAGLEERRLRLAAQMIRSNNGAVTAEQLAPFCDDAPTPAVAQESILVDESFVLPIVTQLNGEPQVTDDGHIIYIFPELQQSAAAAVATPSSSSSASPSTAYLASLRQRKEAKILRRAGLRPDASPYEIQQLLRFSGISTRGVLEKSELVGILEQALPKVKEDDEEEVDVEDPNMLQEREFKFSLASDLNKFLAGGLGVVNLLGALYLGGRLAPLAAAATSMYQVPAWFSLVITAFPWLLTYAVVFNAIPLFRSWYIRQQNDKIRQRNQGRRLWRAVVGDRSNNRELQTKLQAAKLVGRKLLQQQRQRERLGASKDVIFDTSQPMEDRDKMRQIEAMKEFDKQLGQRKPEENDEKKS